MRDWKQVRVDARIDVYFCDPHAPWQRGSNENTNGLLRQYFPKGTDFSTLTEAELDAVADELNGRPRKRLGFANPTDQLTELLLQRPPESAAPLTGHGFCSRAKGGRLSPPLSGSRPGRCQLSMRAREARVASRGDQSAVEQMSMRTTSRQGASSSSESNARREASIAAGTSLRAASWRTTGSSYKRRSSKTS
jgi:hypothetical protein